MIEEHAIRGCSISHIPIFLDTDARTSADRVHLAIHVIGQLFLGNRQPNLFQIDQVILRCDKNAGEEVWRNASKIAMLPNLPEPTPRAIADKPYTSGLRVIAGRIIDLSARYERGVDSEDRPARHTWRQP